MFIRKKNQNKIYLPRRNWRQLPSLINKVLVGLIIVLSIGYIVSINNLSIKGFVISDYKTKVNNLTKENNEIELTITQLESNDSLDSRARQLAMVKVDKIDYLTVVGNRVAKK